MGVNCCANDSFILIWKTRPISFNQSIYISEISLITNISDSGDNIGKPIVFSIVIHLAFPFSARMALSAMSPRQKAPSHWIFVTAS